jgi:hypothetical protein
MDEATKQELLKNDPFIKLWANNYAENFTLGYLGESRAKPVLFLKNTGKYLNFPVVLVAAGPSVDKNIKDLKDKQDNCLIVCADVVLFKLIENGIKPDFVVNIDPHESVSKFFSFLDTSDLCLVCPTTVNPKTIKAWKGKILYFNQTDVPNTPKGDALKRITAPTIKWGEILNRFFIGATMLQFVALFRPSYVILVGYDFAYSGGKAYCDGFLDIKIHHAEDPVGSEEHSKMIEKLKNEEMKKDIYIKGALGGESLWTSNVLHFYLKVFKELAAALKLKLVNSTEGGILMGLPQVPLATSLERYCPSKLNKVDPFEIPHRKRKRRNK